MLSFPDDAHHLARHNRLMPSPALLTVDLAALVANYRTLERIGAAPVHPVVKADAYGLGAAPVARRLMAEGARVFFVARLTEGEILRDALGGGPTIHVLDGCTPGDAARLRSANLSPVLNSAEQLAEWTAAGGGPCGLSIDTGMNRLGFRPEDAPAPFDGLTLIMSHLACADDPAAEMNRRQRDAFAAVCGRYPGVTRSFAGSGGVFLGPDFAFDATRPGISLYGGGPEGRPDPRLRAVAAFTAPVLQVRDVPVGESVGYARGLVADTPRRIATVGAGYADGVLRAYGSGGSVWINGVLRPLAGRVSMDVCAVDVTGLKVGIGDRTEFFGVNRPIDDAARAAGTIAYELQTAVSARVARATTG